LKHNRRSRQVMQAILVATAVKESARYLFFAILNREGEFTSRRDGNKVRLRTRGDLQVAREFISHHGPVLPPDIGMNSTAINAAESVIDLGANIGLFTIWAARTFPHSRVIAIEPDPDNAALLRRNLALNGIEHRVDVMEVAAGAKADTISFITGRAELSRQVFPGDHVEGTQETLVIDILPLLAASEIVKIDIEGAEWPILRDVRFPTCSPQLLMMEWHYRGSEASDPGIEARSLLQDAGFEVLSESRDSDRCGFVSAGKHTLKRRG
ncbi:MAG: FkbM family methyltransferase, partial [Thermomicrobiales bacterium]